MFSLSHTHKQSKNQVLTPKIDLAKMFAQHQHVLTTVVLTKICPYKEIKRLNIYFILLHVITASSFTIMYYF